jgi:hypothetical protein
MVRSYRDVIHFGAGKGRSADSFSTVAHLNPTKGVLLPNLHPPTNSPKAFYKPPRIVLRFCLHPAFVVRNTTPLRSHCLCGNPPKPFLRAIYSFSLILRKDELCQILGRCTCFTSYLRQGGGYMRPDFEKKMGIVASIARLGSFQSQSQSVTLIFRAVSARLPTRK